MYCINNNIYNREKLQVPTNNNFERKIKIRLCGLIDVMSLQ